MACSCSNSTQKLLKPGVHIHCCSCVFWFCHSGLALPPLQIEAGIEDVSPGPATERFLKRKMRVVRVWGAFLVAVLATAAQGFDRMCSETLGTSLGSVSLLLVVGLITSSIRQVLHTFFLCLLHCSTAQAHFMHLSLMFTLSPRDT